jgi:HSP20 family molecular chaperone IbpA
MSETAGLDGTDWTMDIYGTDEKLTKLVLTIDMEELIKNTYETVKDVYDYDDFIELMKSTMEESVDGFEESFTSELGASNVEAEGKVNWISDEVLELTISLTGATAEELELDLDEDDSVIEAAVEELEESMNTTFKEVK